MQQAHTCYLVQNACQVIAVEAQPALCFKPCHVVRQGQLLCDKPMFVALSTVPVRLLHVFAVIANSAWPPTQSLRR